MLSQRARSHVAAAAMDAAGFSGYAAVARKVLGASGCLLTFHRVAPSERWASLPDRDYHIDAGFLHRLIGYVRASGYDIVTMDEVLARARSGDNAKPFVNFSIDDVYRDSAEVAVPLFRRQECPVTLFVTSGIPDGTMSLWYSGMETIISAEGEIRLPDGSVADTTTAEQKQACFRLVSSRWTQEAAPAEYERFCVVNRYDPVDLHRRNAITWDMLEELRDDPLVEIGGHTITHPRLAALPAASAQQEIAGCRSRLQQRLGVPVRHFAFPFGRKGDCGPREFQLARDAGYATASTTRKGLVRKVDDAGRFSLPRNTLNGSHRRTSQVETHLSGLGGILSSLARAMAAT